MKIYEELKEFYAGRKVLVTGHTGFKGSCLCVLLGELGAEVYGYGLPAPTRPSLFEILFGEGSSGKSAENLKLRTGRPEGQNILDTQKGENWSEERCCIRSSCIGDIRDYGKLKTFYDEAEPDVVIHMAAQPIVRESYAHPVSTYEINVMGTVNLLECIRFNPIAESVLNVTTDKVYLNPEKPGYGCREGDPLDGYDPYSNSKSCSELVTHSYRSSFLTVLDVAVSTARAGNVIGGGDFATDRIIPDCVRAYVSGKNMILRNPFSVRPYQHVLEPLTAYLLIAMRQAKDRHYQGWYNVGPDDCDAVTTGDLCRLFKEHCGREMRVLTPDQTGAPHEAGYLKLDNTLLKKTFGWEPVWHIDKAVEAVCRWTDAWQQSPESACRELLRQIGQYMEDAERS